MNSIMATSCLITVIANDKQFTLFNQFDGMPEARGKNLFSMLEQSDEYLLTIPKLTFFDFFELQKDEALRKSVFSDIRNNTLLYPEYSIIDESLSLRFYDNACLNLKGVVTGATNFLVHNNIQDVAYEYIINFDTRELLETKFGINLSFSKSPNLCSTDFFKKLTLTLECILEPSIFKDFDTDDVLSIEEISDFPNFDLKGYANFFEY